MTDDTLPPQPVEKDFVAEWPPPSARENDPPSGPTDDGGPYSPDRVHPTFSHPTERPIQHSDADLARPSPATAHHRGDIPLTTESDNARENR